MRGYFFCLLFFLRSVSFSLDLFGKVVTSSEIEILKIGVESQLKSQEDIIYTGSVDSECHLVPEAKVKFRRDKNKEYLLDSFYFSLHDYKIDNSGISFSITSAKNITFTIYIKKDVEKNTCILERFIETDNDKVKFKKIELYLNKYLGAYNLNYIKIIPEHPNHKISPIFKLFPWDLQGHMPFYEGHVGLAMNTHSNIFVKNEKRFNKDKTITEPVPLLMLRYGPLFLSKDGLGLLVSPFRFFTLLGTILLEGEPHRNSEIETRKSSLYYGFLAKIDMLEIQYYREMLKRHYGHVWKLSLAPEFQLTRRLTLGPRIYLQKWGRDYVNYYFGLKEHEAFEGNSFYQARRSYNYGISLNSIYKNKKIQYILTTELKQYGTEVKNSPLVRKDLEFRFITGIFYQIF